MAGDYYLEVRSPTGTVLGQIDDYWTLGYHKEVNAPGWLKFVLDGNNSKLSLLQDKAQILVMRSDSANGVAPYEDFCGIFRKQVKTTKDADVIEIECPGVAHILSWRVNAFYADLSNRSAFTNKPAETIMKTLVTYNFTASATTGNNRKRTGTMSNPFTISVAADSARGNSLDRNNSGVNILKELAEIAGIGGLDFKLTRTGAATWQFDVGVPYLGTNKQSSVIFSVYNGNMADPEYTYDAIDEKTVAIVAGQDQKSKRQFAIRTSGAYSSNNNIEMWVDARNDGATSAGMNAAGDKALRASRVQEEFKYTVRQSPASRYKLDYDLGDVVGARYDPINIAQKVQAVTIEYEKSSGKENITPELANV